MAKVSFLGAGLHTALGSSVADCVRALQQAPPSAASLPCSLSPDASEVPYFLLSDMPYEDVEGRFHRVIFQVAEQAIEQAGLTSEQRRKMGLFLGSSSFAILEEENRFRRALQDEAAPIPLADCGMGNLAEAIRRRLGLRGEDYTFNTACTSSANALWYAHQLIQMGVIEHALVIGVEFVNTTTTYGFQGLQLLSPTTMRPFDAQRNGLVLGESCSALVLGNSVTAGRFYLRGAANLCDTYSMSTTKEDGSAVKEVIDKALQSAALSAADITAIKCHGTATLSGDAAEANGMLTSFAKLPPCTTLKPYIGHTLGACGLSELILFCNAVESGFLPGAPGIDAQAGVGFTLNQEASPIGAGNFMLNYFGFGGNSTSLVVSNLAGDRG